MSNEEEVIASLAAIIERELNQMGEDVKGISWFSSVAKDYAQRATNEQ